MHIDTINLVFYLVLCPQNGLKPVSKPLDIQGGCFEEVATILLCPKALRKQKPCLISSLQAHPVGALKPGRFFRPSPLLITQTSI